MFVMFLNQKAISLILWNTVETGGIYLVQVLKKLLSRSNWVEVFFFFSPSLLMNGCLVTFNEAGFNRSYFLLQLVFFWECFMSIFTSSLRRLSFSILFSLSFFNWHPSKSSLLFTLTSLRSSPIGWSNFRARPHACQCSFTGRRAGWFVSFPIRKFVSINAMAICWVGGGARSHILLKERRMFFPKTTMSWHRCYV